MRRIGFSAIMVLAIAVAGCSRQAPEPAAQDNAPVAAAPVEVPPPPPPPVETAPRPKEENSAAEVPPPEPIKPDAQIQDDADATGMTARMPADAQDSGDGGQATNASDR